SLESGQGQLRIDEPIVGCLFADDGIQPLDSVVLLTETGERFPPSIGQTPNSEPLFDGQLEVLQGLKPCHAIPTLRSRSAEQPLQSHRAVGLNMFAQKAIEHGDALGPNIGLARPGILEVRPGPELAGDNFLRPPAHVLLDVVGVNPDLVAIDVDAPDVDMDVGIGGVVMIDGGPDQASSEVVLDLLHQPSREFFEIELVPVLGRNDESKLPLLTVQTGTEGIPIESLVGSV